MNASSLTIDKMFAGNADVGLTSALGSRKAGLSPRKRGAEVEATQDARQFVLTPADSPPPANTPETTPTDNTLTGVQSEPANRQSQEFCCAIGKTITPKTSLPAQANAKSEKQGPNPDAAAEQPNIVQLWLAKYSLNVEHGKEGVATKVTPKAGYELAQLLANLKADKSPPDAGQTARPAATKPGQMVPATSQPENKPLQPAIDQSQTGLKDVLLNTSDGPILAETKDAATKSSAQMPTATVTAEKGLSNRQSSKELMSEALVESGSSKTTTAGEKSADSPSGGSVPKNLSLTQVQISTGQTEDHGSSTSDNSSNSDAGRFEQIVSHVPPNGAQSTITERFSDASAQAVKTASNASPDNVSTSISAQILESIHSGLRQGEKQITIRLNPPELGKVFIKFQEQQGQGEQITGLLEVSRIQTRVEIQQALPQLVRDLADCGIQIKRLEVVLLETDQQEQQVYKDQSSAGGQNGWLGQQTGAERGNSNNAPAQNQLTSTLKDGYAGLAEPQEGFITDNSINMLI